ncbi:MAG: hypothetical protein ACI4KI_05530 [Candidatus Fimenecus sp.]
MQPSIGLIAAIAGYAVLCVGAATAVRVVCRKHTGRFRKKTERKFLSSEERKQLYVYERNTPTLSTEEQLKALGYTVEQIDAIRSDALKRNYYDGKYHADKTAQPGSVDNPLTVGIPECSDSLQFSIERNQWVLTDGLGNGWSR